jgi:hypothetical protein
MGFAGLNPYYKYYKYLSGPGFQRLFQDVIRAQQ